VKALSGVNAINLFKQAVGAGFIPVRIYSIDQEVLMRELTVTDQKTLSKTALINNNRRDIMYAAQNSLINSCVKNKGFDIRELTEFDRVVFLLRLYQQNYFTNDIKYTCPKCGKENVYKMDFGAMLNKVKDAWRGERTYVLNHGDKEFHFTVAWPKVSMISQFYNSYYKQYQKANEKTQSTIDQLSNVEYLVMFIRKIELFLPNTTEGVSLNLDDYTYDQRTDIIDSLPQGLVFDDNNGIISKVIADFTDPLNKSFRYENCQFCGAETEEGIGSIADFI
jgi:transcription elongation factor Elf1